MWEYQDPIEEAERLEREDIEEDMWELEYERRADADN